MNKTRKRVAFYKWYKKKQQKERKIDLLFICLLLLLLYFYIQQKQIFVRFGFAFIGDRHQQTICVHFIFNTLLTNICVCVMIVFPLDIGHAIESNRRLITNPNDLCLIENNVKH